MVEARREESLLRLANPTRGAHGVITSDVAEPSNTIAAP
jgi:hypothetical protein